MKRVVSLFLVFIFGWSSYILKSQLTNISLEYATNQYYKSQILFDNDLIKLSEQYQAKIREAYAELPVYEKNLLLKSEIEFHLGRQEFALKSLEKYINDFPFSLFVPFFYEKVGTYLFELGNYEKALPSYQKGYESGAKQFESTNDSAYFELSARCLFWAGVTSLKLGRVDDSRIPFERCFRNFSKTTFADEALYFLGIISEMKGEEEIAIKYYKTLQKDFPRSNLILASKIREANNYLSLRQDVQALIALDFAENVHLRISAQDSIGRLYEKQTYSEDIEEKVLFLRAEAYKIARRFDEAIQTYNTLLERFPNSKYYYDAQLGIGLAYLEKGEFLKSIESFEKIIEKIKDNNSIQRQIAELYNAVANRRLGRISVAQSLFSDLVVRSNYPFLTYVLLELGMIYYEKKEFEQAQRTFERGLRESSDNILSLRLNLMLGATFLELKQWHRAIQHFKSAEELAKKTSSIQLPNRDWIIVEARLKQSIAQIRAFRNTEAIENLLFIVGNYPKDSRNEEALFWLAEAYYRSDMLRNAIDKYELLMLRYPSTKFLEDALYGLGWSYFRLKNFKKSSETFGQLLKLFPDSKYNVEVWLRQGDGYYVLKDFKNAINSYQKVINLKPQSEEAQYAHYQICHSFYKLGDLNEAYNQVLEFIKKFPNSIYAPNAMYLNGWIRFQQKKYDEAINNFNFLIDAYPNSLLVPRAKYAIADALYNQNRFEEALNKYKEIIESYPTSPLVADALQSIQFCYIALGREQEAFTIADEYIAKNPESPFAADFALKKGTMFYSGKNFKSAIAEYQNFVEKFPESNRKPEALFWLAKSYQALGENNNAITTFKQIVNNYPSSEFAPQSMLELGLIYKSIASVTSADSIFSELLKKYPEDPASAQAGFEQATIKFTLGDTATALTIWDWIAENFEETEFGEQSIYKIAMYYRFSGKFDEAIKYFTRISESQLDPNLAAEAQYRIGEIYYRRRQIDKAIEEFTKVRVKFAGIEDWFTLALLNLGDAYEQLGNYEEAINCYREILAVRESDDFTATAKRRIQVLEQKLHK
ncbi:MAG: tetratricopeptide repeat protein [Ignavibacteria bacterium]|nr:tetratricopeptide repeat protein [Ignavibacteria bacterium]